MISAIANVFQGIARPMTIRCGGETIRGPQSLACACNGQFYGGGFHPSLTARPDDGVLDIFIVKKVSLPLFAALIGKYAAGKAAEMSKYVYHLQGDAIEIDFEKEDVVNLDGEALYAKEVRMKLIPGALRLIVPAGMYFFERP